MCKENGVLVTSFAGIRQHQDHLLAQRFDYVILDEGHKIRNPDAEITLACKQVKLQAVLFYVKSLDTYYDIISAAGRAFVRPWEDWRRIGERFIGDR